MQCNPFSQLLSLKFIHLTLGCDTFYTSFDQCPIELHTQPSARIQSSQIFAIGYSLKATYLLLQLVVVRHKRGKLAGLVETRAEQTRNLLDHTLGRQEGCVLLGCIGKEQVSDKIMRNQMCSTENDLVSKHTAEEC